MLVFVGEIACASGDVVGTSECFGDVRILCLILSKWLKFNEVNHFSPESFTYSVSQKSSHLKTFCNIFSQVKYISVKFCQCVASLDLHKFTNFGRFILIFNKTALIFLGVPIIFNFFSFKFHQVRLP